MNRIPLSLWKEIVRTKKNSVLWQTITDLGKDLGPEDHNWIIETNTYLYNMPGNFFSYWFWDWGGAVELGQPLFRCACWLRVKDDSQEAMLRFIENTESVLSVSFFGLEALISGPEVYQKLFRCPKIRVSCPRSSLGPPRVQDFSQSQSDFSSFSDQQMEKIIRVYQACSPLTFWFIEDMARFLHEKAKTKSLC